MARRGRVLRHRITGACRVDVGVTELVLSLLGVGG
jgi:hypothetical protein